MSTYAYVGGAASGQGGAQPRGISLFRRDDTTGKLILQADFVSGKDPTFLKVHPNKQFVYAVIETVEGGASAYALDQSGGGLTLLNSQPTNGVHPCHVNFDPAGKFMLVSNYSSGSLSVFPIQADGTLAPMSDCVFHRGSGPHKNQERAHAHSMGFDPSGNFLLAADLGLDRILVYRLDQNGKLVLHTLSGAAMTPGAGPRHFVFHPNGHILYSANELNSSVTVCQWDGEKGILVPVQTESTLPVDFQGENAVADIHLHPNGKTLYISNRGHNSLAVFQVAPDASLKAAGHVSCGGNWPRNFAVDPSGKWLYVANQRSGNLATYRVNPESGWPEELIDSINTHSPMCIELTEF